MPIKLVSSPNDENPMEITLADYHQGVQNFENHYYLEGSGTEFGGKDFCLPYTDIEDVIQAFEWDNDILPENVAVRFIHCFDEDTQSLYLRMQLCTMHLTGEVIDGHRIYALSFETCAWYNLMQDSLSDTEDHNEQDEPYRNNFYYATETGELVPIAEGDTFVNSLTFPWFHEIRELYNQNGKPEGARIHFSSCSYLTTNEGEIPWPHGLVMYLEDADGNILLNDNDYMTLFTNKGADFGTACPPACPIYIAPTAYPL